MTEPTCHFMHCPDAANGHRMAYWSWGHPEADHVVLCVHGLTRQGRDFDVLSRTLCERAERAGQRLRVVCPDVVGRGESDWLVDPMAYQVPTYAADMLTLIGHLRATTLDWVGTSMGGLIGMAVCAHLGQAGVRRLVLNDVGPTIEWQALQRIGLGVPDVAAAVALLKARGVEFVESSQLHPEDRGALTRSALGSVSFELVHQSL